MIAPPFLSLLLAALPLRQAPDAAAWEGALKYWDTQTVEAIRQAWGPPPDRVPIGSGEIWVYRYFYVADLASPGSTPALARGANGLPVDPGDVLGKTECTVSFTIDPLGSVSHLSSEGDCGLMCRDRAFSGQDVAAHSRAVVSGWSAGASIRYCEAPYGHAYLIHAETGEIAVASTSDIPFESNLPRSP